MEDNMMQYRSESELELKPLAINNNNNNPSVEEQVKRNKIMLLLVDPTNSVEDVAQLCGVSKTYVVNLLKNEKYRTQYFKSVEAGAAAKYGKVLAALEAKIEEGDLKAIKLYLGLMGRITTAPNGGNINVNISNQTHYNAEKLQDLSTDDLHRLANGHDVKIIDIDVDGFLQEQHPESVDDISYTNEETEFKPVGYSSDIEEDSLFDDEDDIEDDEESSWDV